VRTDLRENLYAVSFSDARNGFAVGSGGVILRTTDAGASWKDQESPLRSNLYAVTAISPTDAIAVGENGTVLVTSTGGQTWESQANVTSKLLQAVVYRGEKKLWIAGRGGTILKRIEALTPATISAPKLPPILGSRSSKPRPRVPLVPITDDGDIPTAIKPPREKN
jgi:photosystem II stability/assembly factor-like uncharacterized protein